MEMVETGEAKIRAVSVAPRLKNWSASTGQSYLDEQTLIVMGDWSLEQSTVFFMPGQHF